MKEMDKVKFFMCVRVCWDAECDEQGEKEDGEDGNTRQNYNVF